MSRSTRRLARSLALAALAAVAPVTASAQTIRPISAEFETKARGRFEVVNDGDRPLTVVIQARGFSVNERGEMQDAPLPAGIDVKLSASSLRLPPRQSRLVFYEATAEATPAWFVFYAVFGGYSARDFSGLNVQLELPHLVYILPKARWTAKDVHVSAPTPRDNGRLVIELENRGTQFGRLTGVEIRSGRGRVQVPGFALFPGVRRRLEVPWDGREVPEAIVVSSKDFSFQTALALDGR